MNPDIYMFEKTKDDRLREFSNILCLMDKPTPSAEIKKEWCFFLQEAIEPAGWNAVWYVSRQECEELGILFPTVLLVLVEDVDFPNFSALVKVIAVKEETSIAKRHMASLKQLYPTISQDESIAMNVERTADYLEQFRFFFDYLWMPWDEDSDEQNWPSIHLEPRLDLYYDLMSDDMRSMAVYLKTLLQEGKDVHQKIKCLEKDIDEEGQDEEERDDVDHSRVQALMELHTRQEQIKGEVEWLESPVLRTLMVKKQQKESSADEIFCVCEVATAEEIIDHLSVVRSQIKPSTPIRLLQSLREALDRSKCGQQIFIFPGIHCIRKSSSMEVGHIKGVGGYGVTTLTSQSSGSCLLQVLSKELTLEGLTLDASTVQMALAVSMGVLKLHNCRVISSGGSSINEGIVVLEGGKLQATHCKFISFGTAISAKAGAEVVIELCSFNDCHVGIQLCETANVSLLKTSIAGCKDCGIKIETTKLTDDITSRYGDLNLLESFSEVKLQACDFSENGKGDVLLVQQPSCLLYDSTDSGCSFSEL